MIITGRLVLLALVGIPLCVLAPGIPMLVAVVIVIVALAALDASLAGSVRALTIARRGDTSVRLGETATVELLVSNPGRRRVRGAVRDAWTPTAGATPRLQEIDLAAGDRVVRTTTLTPTRRGDRHPDRVTIRSYGPLRLAARQSSHTSPWTLRALPAFESRKHLPSRLARLRELDGRTAVMVRGQGTEFDSLREYVDGDDVRSIDWRATARASDVMVRTWRPERDRRVFIALDCGRTSAGRVGDAPRLDAAMDAALLLSALAARAGDHVDLLAFDRSTRTSVRGTDGPSLLAQMVQALAPIEPALVETDMQALVSEVLQRQRQRSLVVLLTALDAAAVSQTLMPALPALVTKHQVIVCSVRDPRIDELMAERGSIEAFYANASASSDAESRAETAERLSRLGIEVVDAAPEALAPALADRYLALKAAGRL